MFQCLFKSCNCVGDSLCNWLFKPLTVSVLSSGSTFSKLRAMKVTTDNIKCEPTTIISNSKGRCRRTTWHPPMDRYFIGLMLDQVRSGNQIEGVFMKQAWARMVKLFNTKFESNFCVDVLKNRFKTLRRQIKAVKSLLRSDGFGWDDERQMVTAEDNVWQDYIKAHHRYAKQFMLRPVPYFKDLCVLCGDSEIKENDCFVATDRFNLETEFQEFKSSGTINLSSSGEEEDINSLLFEPKNKRDRFGTAETSPIKPKKSRVNETKTMGIEDALGTADTSPVKPKKPRVDETKTMGIEDAVEAIQALPDMDEELILDACDLIEDELKAKTFLALDVKLRKKWLLRKLRPQVTLRL